MQHDNTMNTGEMCNAIQKAATIWEWDNVEFKMSTMWVGEGKDLMYSSSSEALFYRTVYATKMELDQKAQTLQSQVPSTKTIVLIRK